MNLLIGKRVKYTTQNKLLGIGHAEYVGLIGTIISYALDPDTSEFIALVLFGNNKFKSIYLECVEFIPGGEHTAGDKQ